MPLPFLHPDPPPHWNASWNEPGSAPTTPSSRPTVAADCFTPPALHGLSATTKAVTQSCTPPTDDEATPSDDDALCTHAKLVTFFDYDMTEGQMQDTFERLFKMGGELVDRQKRQQQLVLQQTKDSLPKIPPVVVTEPRAQPSNSSLTQEEKRPEPATGSAGEVDLITPMDADSDDVGKVGVVDKMPIKQGTINADLVSKDKLSKDNQNTPISTSSSSSLRHSSASHKSSSSSRRSSSHRSSSHRSSSHRSPSHRSSSHRSSSSRSSHRSSSLRSSSHKDRSSRENTSKRKSSRDSQRSSRDRSQRDKPPREPSSRDRSSRGRSDKDRASTSNRSSKAVGNRNSRTAPSTVCSGSEEIDVVD